MCVWKARFQALVVDERVQSRGVSMASYCDCCFYKVMESIDHVLRLGDVANHVWEHYY